MTLIVKSDTYQGPLGLSVESKPELQIHPEKWKNQGFLGYIEAGGTLKATLRVSYPPDYQYYPCAPGLFGGQGFRVTVLPWAPCNDTSKVTSRSNPVFIDISALGTPSLEPKQIVMIDGTQEELELTVQSKGYEGDLVYSIGLDQSPYPYLHLEDLYERPLNETDESPYPYLHLEDLYETPHNETEQSGYNYLGTIKPGELKATIPFTLTSTGSLTEPVTVLIRAWVGFLGCSGKPYYHICSYPVMVTVFPEDHEQIYTGCPGAGISRVVLKPENSTIKIGEETEVILTLHSGDSRSSVCNVSYEGNISLSQVFLDFDGVIQEGYEPPCGLFELDYLVEGNDSENPNTLGFLEAGEELERRIRIKIRLLVDDEGEPYYAFRQPTTAYLGVAVSPTACQHPDRSDWYWGPPVGTTLSLSPITLVPDSRKPIWETSIIGLILLVVITTLPSQPKTLYQNHAQNQIG